MTHSRARCAAVAPANTDLQADVQVARTGGRPPVAPNSLQKVHLIVRCTTLNAGLVAIAFPYLL